MAMLQESSTCHYYRQFLCSCCVCRNIYWSGD